MRAYACACVLVSISIYACIRSFRWVHVAVYVSLMLCNVCFPCCMLACVYAAMRAGVVMLAQCLMRTSRARSLKSTLTASVDLAVVTCSMDLCQNNATCSDLKYVGFTCDCSLYFKGAICAIGRSSESDTLKQKFRL